MTNSMTLKIFSPKKVKKKLKMQQFMPKDSIDSIDSRAHSSMKWPIFGEKMVEIAGK
jgi:hypothetical protein